MLVISIILWGLLGLLILLLVLLVSPVRLDIRAVAERHPYTVVRARLFGGLAPSLPIVDSRRKNPKKEKRKEKKKKAKKNAKSTAQTKRDRLKNGPALVQDFVKMIGDILRKIHINHLSLRVEFGFDDPADTGHAFGLMTPLVYGSSALARSTVLLQPNFERRCFSGELDTSLRFIPISLVLPAIGFIWTNFGPMR